MPLIGPKLPRDYRTVPEHGRYSRYVIFKCRCDPCRDAVNTYRRRQNRLRGYAGRTLIATDEESQALRDRVRRLVEDHGWNLKALAGEAGMPHETFQGWYAGRKKNPHLKNLQTIQTMLDRLENDSEVLSPGQRAARAVDRLNVLNGMGWTIRQITEVAGIGANLSLIVNGHQLPRPVTVAKLDRAWDVLTGPGGKPARQDLKGRASKARGLRPTIEADTPRTVRTEEAAKLITRLQRYLGLTQVQVADQAGLPVRTINRITRGHQKHVHDDTMTALEELAHREGIYA